MNQIWYLHLAWIGAAALLGLGVAWIFAGLLRLPRNLYLVPYIVGVLALGWAYLAWSGVAFTNLILNNWAWGLLGAVIIGFITIRHILSQPASAHAAGFRLVFDLLWSGFLYGFADALLLSVLPVLATWRAFSLLGWTSNWPGMIAVGLLAVLASMLVTTAYHAGYPEFRGRRMITANVGNTVMTLGCLITANPLAALLSHSAMHMVAVLHGPERVVQLPPHYAA